MFANVYGYVMVYESYKIHSKTTFVAVELGGGHIYIYYIDPRLTNLNVIKLLSNLYGYVTVYDLSLSILFVKQNVLKWWGVMLL